MYHFIGIKGAGMSSLAIILKQLGYEVTGSDVDKHFFTEEGLIKNKISFKEYNEENICSSMIIVQGASIKEDNVEVIRAKELGLKIYLYNEMLGELTRNFKTICIAGCHGKTTTTAMIAHVYQDLLGLNYLIGDGTGKASPNNQYFAVESCEYRRHFLKYQPYYAIITNIDIDHVDYFTGLDDIIDAYNSYANLATKMIIAYGDDANVRKMSVTKPIVYYGLESTNDIYATNVVYNQNGTSFDVISNQEIYGHFELPIFGQHQLLDALATISLGILEKLDAEDVYQKFITFRGAKRRFHQTVIGNNVIIDDYAHHPNEVKATIAAIKQKYPNKKIVAIFQPHTYSRTQDIAPQLIEVLKEVDVSYILDIHPAREKQEDFPEITSSIIVEQLENSYYLSQDEAHLLSSYDNCVFIFMSPNDLSKLETDLENILKNNE